MLYIVKFHAGIVGTDNSEIVEADSEEEAISYVLDTAWEWFWNFNDESDFEEIEPELDIRAEKYNEEFKLFAGVAE